MLAYSRKEGSASFCFLFNIFLLLQSHWTESNGRMLESRDKECKFIYKNNEGYIDSPNYPNNYPNKYNCSYTVQAMENYLICFEIQKLVLEPSKLCNFDKLSLYDGKDTQAPLLRTFCGTVSPEVTYSSGSSITAVFTTDSDGSLSGFRIRYKAIPKCSKELSSLKGQITSPGYPSPYPNNIECNYVIKVADDQTVHVKFEDFNLEGVILENCFDYVQIARYGESSWEKLGEVFCGDEAPRNFCVDSKSVLIKFTADHMVSKRGFKATFEIGDVKCNGTKHEKRKLVVDQKPSKSALDRKATEVMTTKDSEKENKQAQSSVISLKHHSKTMRPLFASSSYIPKLLMSKSIIFSSSKTLMHGKVMNSSSPDLVMKSLMLSNSIKETFSNLFNATHVLDTRSSRQLKSSPYNDGYVISEVRPTQILPNSEVQWTVANKSTSLNSFMISELSDKLHVARSQTTVRAVSRKQEHEPTFQHHRKPTINDEELIITKRTQNSEEKTKFRAENIHSEIVPTSSSRLSFITGKEVFTSPAGADGENFNQASSYNSIQQMIFSSTVIEKVSPARFADTGLISYASLTVPRLVDQSVAPNTRSFATGSYASLASDVSEFERASSSSSPTTPLISSPTFKHHFQISKSPSASNDPTKMAPASSSKQVSILERRSEIESKGSIPAESTFENYLSSIFSSLHDITSFPISLSSVVSMTEVLSESVSNQRIVAASKDPSAEPGGWSKSETAVPRSALTTEPSPSQSSKKTKIFEKEIHSTKIYDSIKLIDEPTVKSVVVNVGQDLGLSVSGSQITTRNETIVRDVSITSDNAAFNELIPADENDIPSHGYTIMETKSHLMPSDVLLTPKSSCSTSSAHSLDLIPASRSFSVCSKCPVNKIIILKSRVVGNLQVESNKDNIASKGKLDQTPEHISQRATDIVRSFETGMVSSTRSTTHISSSMEKSDQNSTSFASSSTIGYIPVTSIEQVSPTKSKYFVSSSLKSLTVENAQIDRFAKFESSWNDFTFQQSRMQFDTSKIIPTKYMSQEFRSFTDTGISISKSVTSTVSPLFEIETHGAEIRPTLSYGVLHYQDKFFTSKNLPNSHTSSQSQGAEPIFGRNVTSNPLKFAKSSFPQMQKQVTDARTQLLSAVASSSAEDESSIGIHFYRTVRMYQKMQSNDANDSLMPHKINTVKATSSITDGIMLQNLRPSLTVDFHSKTSSLPEHSFIKSTPALSIIQNPTSSFSMLMLRPPPAMKNLTTKSYKEEIYLLSSMDVKSSSIPSHFQPHATIVSNLHSSSERRSTVISSNKRRGEMISNNSDKTQSASVTVSPRNSEYLELKNRATQSYKTEDQIRQSGYLDTLISVGGATQQRNPKDSKFATKAQEINPYSFSTSSSLQNTHLLYTASILYRSTAGKHYDPSTITSSSMQGTDVGIKASPVISSISQQECSTYFVNDINTADQHLRVSIQEILDLKLKSILAVKWPRYGFMGKIGFVHKGSVLETEDGKLWYNYLDETDERIYVINIKSLRILHKSIQIIYTENIANITLRQHIEAWDLPVGIYFRKCE